MLRKDDIEEIKKGLEALTQSSMKLGEAMYKAQQQENPQPKVDPGQQGSDPDQKRRKGC